MHSSALSAITAGNPANNACTCAQLMMCRVLALNTASKPSGGAGSGARPGCGANTACSGHGAGALGSAACARRSAMPGR